MKYGGITAIVKSYPGGSEKSTHLGIFFAAKPTRARVEPIVASAHAGLTVTFAAGVFQLLLDVLGGLLVHVFLDRLGAPSTVALASPGPGRSVRGPP